MKLEYLCMIWSFDKLAHYADGVKLRSKRSFVIEVNLECKSNVNVRLFKWSVQLSIYKNKVTIVHHPGRNMTSSSRKTGVLSCYINSYVGCMKRQVIERVQKEPCIPNDFASIAISRDRQL